MSHQTELAARGFTLVELMVVIVLIAILAGLAIASFSNSVDEGKITQLKRFAKEVEKGQQQYSSRNGRFFTPGTLQYNPGDVEWEELLEFNHENINPDIRVLTEAGTDGENCTICPDGLAPDTTRNWYAIAVCRDLDGNPTGGANDCGDDTTVYLDNEREDPFVVNEGQ